MAIQYCPGDEDGIVLLEMFAFGHCLLESAVADLLGYYEETGLVRHNFEYFDDELWFDVFEFFEVFGEFDVWEFDDFDGDWQIGFELAALPHTVVVAGEQGLVFGVVVLFEDFLVLFHDGL